MEMGYMLMQAFDFVHLNDKFNCVLQIGGSDQWGNIVAGVELSRKMNFNDGNERPLMMGLTCPLLTNAEGVKMGKTEKGTLWVSREKTSPFEFFQHFVNCLDADVERLLRFFTSIKIDEIKELCLNDIVKAGSWISDTLPSWREHPSPKWGACGGTFSRMKKRTGFLSPICTSRAAKAAKPITRCWRRKMA